MKHDLIEGIEAGFFDYLTKPFSIDEVMTNIDAALALNAENAGPKAY